MNFEPSTIQVISIVSVATLLRSTFGFADAMFAMPLLAVIIGFSTYNPKNNLTESPVQDAKPFHRISGRIRKKMVQRHAIKQE